MKKDYSSMICCLSWIILIISGINWGCVGLFNFDAIAYIFGYASPVTPVVYVIFGLAGLYIVANWVYGCCRMGSVRKKR